VGAPPFGGASVCLRENAVARPTAFAQATACPPKLGARAERLSREERAEAGRSQERRSRDSDEARSAESDEMQRVH
jgi:hypothetical protein